MLPIVVAFLLFGTTDVPPEILKNIEAIQRYFPDSTKITSRFLATAYCESRLKQYGEKGVVTSHTADEGILQVHVPLHKKSAEKLGHDIRTLEGNLGYARLLYDNYGLSPWKASRKCSDDVIGKLLSTYDQRFIRIAGG